MAHGKVDLSTPLFSAFQSIESFRAVQTDETKLSNAEAGCRRFSMTDGGIDTYFDSCREGRFRDPFMRYSYNDVCNQSCDSLVNGSCSLNSGLRDHYA